MTLNEINFVSSRERTCTDSAVNDALQERYTRVSTSRKTTNKRAFLRPIRFYNVIVIALFATCQCPCVLDRVIPVLHKTNLQRLFHYRTAHIIINMIDSGLGVGFDHELCLLNFSTTRTYRRSTEYIIFLISKIQCSRSKHCTL